jgi:hypothetical protein
MCVCENKSNCFEYKKEDHATEWKLCCIIVYLWAIANSKTYSESPATASVSGNVAGGVGGFRGEHCSYEIWKRYSVEELCGC